MALSIGSKALEFLLYDADRKLRSLSEFRGRNLVLAFFPGAFTGVCTREMCTFRDSLQELGNLDAQVLAVSVDSPFSNHAFAEKNELVFPILSDYNREVIKLYDIVLHDLGGMKGYVAAKRSVFILDKDGVVRYSWVSDDPAKEPDYQQIKEELRKLRG